MSVATELTKLNTNIKNAYDEIATKGGTIPQNKNTDNLATAISSISGGGGADEYFVTNNTYRLAYAMIKKLPDITTTASNLNGFASSYNSLIEVGNITATNCTNTSSMFMSSSKLESVGTLTLGNVTDTSAMFKQTKISTAPYFNTSYCSNFTQMFYGCSLLENVPVYDWNKATNLTMIFQNCGSLTDQSLDNILQSCISATSFTGSKSLRNTISLDTYYYPNAKIQSLPHYQDFINAGWSI